MAPNRVDVTNYRGPVKNWSENFLKYIKSRTSYTIQSQGHSFHPVIDKQSEKIAKRNGLSMEKVEDRLIKYGQTKKIDKKKQEIEKTKQVKSKQNQAISPELFDRLYFDAEKLNKKKL